MLDTQTLVAFVATTDAARARTFYERTLGLELISDEPFALVFNANGTTIRIQKVAELAPHPFTSLGWNVADLDAMVAALQQKSVAFERFPGMDQDALGIWRAPGGARIAWFKDPDGNLLSLAEF
jgi:catechol 2,3-dioxygenase-like lactoylglutathione lyase family enzyme